MTVFKNLLIITVCLYLPILSFAKDASLVEAYQREFIYLTNQKNNLVESKKKTIKELASELQKLESEVESKLSKLTFLENKTQSLDEEYKSYQGLVAKSESQDRKIQALAQQASETLKSFGYQINEQGESQLILQDSFLLAQKMLGSIDSVKKVKKEIFDKNGIKIKTDVYQFGLISSMAINPDKNKQIQDFGLLAPAGLGELKVVEKSGSFDPFVLDANAKQQYFLYDSLNKPFEAKIEKSIVDVLEAGGLIGYVIVAFGLFGLFVALRRYYILNQYSFNENQKHDFINNIQNIKSLENVATDSKHSEKQWDKAGSLNRLFPLLSRSKNENLHAEAETLILSLERKVSSYGPVLMGIAAVAPLLGLLGTVTGMIATFDVITEIGTGNPKMLSGGISEALVTTKFGLIVAIPCLLIGNWLNSWAKRITKDLYEIYDSTVEESGL